MIETKNLTKTFDQFTAVDSLNLKIEKGEFFGLLGPNGAGKTTTIGLLSTLLLPTEGEILINGQVLTHSRPELKRKISVVTQEYSMRQDMNMDEIMEYQGRLYFMPRKKIKARTDELLDFCGLKDFRKRHVRKLSGGMKRKLMVCRALLTDPEIMLLDEPTTGMDALSRRQMWNLLRQLNQQGLTILLTTHYMEEAQTLCGRVALMDRGRLETIDTPEGLIQSLGKFAVDEFTQEGTRSRFFHSREEAIAALSQVSGRCTLRDTTLEDVFVERAGRRLTPS
ncbi:MAG: ABC transporter ATP-binding protein [Clostridiales bacterium]|nr:ABC transporter ATP-binding protein [Clostridiales bacterium]